MEKIRHYLKFIIPIFILLIIGFVCVYYYINNNTKNNEVIKSEPIKKEEKKEEISKEDIYYYVDIKGAVNNPGIYRLKEESRVQDVINSSGGLKENADTSLINLSKKIFDEMVIVVYTKDEIEKYKNKEENLIEQNNKVVDNLVEKYVNNDALFEDNKSNQEENKNELININTATKDQLLTISGIGESKANSIIKYREENGNFNCIEDIKNVSGIGDSLFEKIKEFITV